MPIWCICLFGVWNWNEILLTGSCIFIKQCFGIDASSFRNNWCQPNVQIVAKQILFIVAGICDAHLKLFAGYLELFYFRGQFHIMREVFTMSAIFVCQWTIVHWTLNCWKYWVVHFVSILRQSNICCIKTSKFKPINYNSITHIRTDKYERYSCHWNFIAHQVLIAR